MVSSCPLAWDTNVPDHTTNSAAGNKNPGALGPHLVQLNEESLVVLHSSELALIGWVLLERPVRRGRDYQVNALTLQVGQVPRIRTAYPMSCDGMFGRPRVTTVKLVQFVQLFNRTRLAVVVSEVSYVAHAADGRTHCVFLPSSTSVTEQKRDVNDTESLRS